jgi:hypothetical protein
MKVITSQSLCRVNGGPSTKVRRAAPQKEISDHKKAFRIFFA